MKKYLRSEVTPDRIIAPDLNIKVHFRAEDQIAGTLCDDVLYFSTIHGDIYKTFSLDHGIDFRIWMWRGIMAFWFDQDDIFKKLEIIRDKLINGDFICINKHIDKTDISDFTVIYKYNKEIMHKKVKEIIENPDTEYSNNKNERLLHLTSPILKKYFESPKDKLNKYLYYLEGCRKWTKRIGNMDVAEWHLLMYEE